MFTTTDERERFSKGSILSLCAELEEARNFESHPPEAETQISLGDLERLTKAVRIMHQNLGSIAANSCCEGCQEAKLVARSALSQVEGEE